MNRLAVEAFRRVAGQSDAAMHRAIISINGQDIACAADPGPIQNVATDRGYERLQMLNVRIEKAVLVSMPLHTDTFIFNGISSWKLVTVGGQADSYPRWILTLERHVS